MARLGFLCISLAAASQTLLADQITGKVVNVFDGDTLVVLTREQTSLKVRLAEIDAPEKSQPWGNKSKQALSALVSAEWVLVNSSGKDNYGRTLGTVFLGEVNINKRMVESGNAWAYTAFVSDKDYFTLQEHAQANAVGLWSMSEADITPPWVWRKKIDKK